MEEETGASCGAQFRSCCVTCYKSTHLLAQVKLWQQALCCLGLDLAVGRAAVHGGKTRTNWDLRTEGAQPLAWLQAGLPLPSLAGYTAAQQ
jgi:hypothetical protein